MRWFLLILKDSSHEIVAFTLSIFVTGMRIEDITKTGGKVFFPFTGVFKFSPFSLNTQIIIYISNGFFKYFASYILGYFKDHIL